MTGVGGQGPLTATTLLARVAVAQGVEVVAGEIHGMAQRGGVVESTILLGGWKSPKLGFGEADIVLGFEPLETLRGLRYLKQGGVHGRHPAVVRLRRARSRSGAGRRGTGRA